MFTIKKDAQKNKILPISLDYMGVSYRTDGNKFVFPSPSFWLLEKNLFFLTANSEKKNFEQKYIMRPDYLSFDEYDTVVLGPLLMYVNKIFTPEDFNLNEVIIPDISAIIEILVDKFPELSVDELEVVDW